MILIKSLIRRAQNKKLPMMLLVKFIFVLLALLSLTDTVEGFFPPQGPGFFPPGPRCVFCPRPRCFCNFRFGERCLYVPRTCFRCDFFRCIRTGPVFGRPPFFIKDQDQPDGFEGGEEIGEDFDDVGQQEGGEL